MTITFNRNDNTFTFAHSGNTTTLNEGHLKRMLNPLGWGDVESHIEAAKQNPGIAINVDNRSRTPRPRNSRVFAVAF